MSKGMHTEPVLVGGDSRFKNRDQWYKFVTENYEGLN